MTKFIFVIQLLLFGIVTFPIQAQYNYSPPKSYACLFINQDLVIDGNPDEPVWNEASWSDPFIDIEGTDKPLPYYNTQFKMLWGDSSLYILAKLEEEHIWGTLTQHDDIIFRDNDFEVFIDPDGDSHQYFEIEINVLNTLFDLMLVKPYRDGGPAIINWDAKGLQSAVKIDGSLNDPTELDKQWFVEMAIPYAAFDYHNARQYPKAGDYWRINFSRVEYRVDIIGQQYQKRKDSIGNELPEYNWVWSPQGIINMHYPEKWGYLVFVKEPVDIEVPLDDGVRQHLYFIYHELNAHFEDKGMFPLALPKQYVINKEQYSCDYFTSGKSFQISLSNPSSQGIWHIREDGRCWKD
jgi:hypothetical protein